MTGKRSTILHNVLRATCAAGLLVCAQAQAATAASPNLSSGLGTLWLYLLGCLF